MVASNDQLINQLKVQVTTQLESIQVLSNIQADRLTQRATPEAWNALEAIDHLNRYGDFYIPEVKKRIRNASKTENPSKFKSSWLGEHFAKSVEAKEKLNKMNTFKNMNPTGTQIEFGAIVKFANQLQEWLEILTALEGYDLKKIKTSITITNLIKLRLGDTLRVVFNHNDRHIMQAQRASNLIKDGQS